MDDKIATLWMCFKLLKIKTTANITGLQENDYIQMNVL